MDQKTKKTIRLFLLSIGATILVYTVLAVWSGIPALLAVIGRISLPQLLVVFVIPVIAYLIRFGRWYWYLSHLQHKLPIWNSLRFYYSGFLFVLTPARAGLAIRSVYLRKYDVPYADSLWVMFLEQVNDITGMMILSLLVMSLFSDSLSFILPVGFGIVVLSLISTHSTSVLRLVHERRLVRFLPRLEALIAKAEQTSRVATRLFNVKMQMTGLVITILSFFLQSLSFYLIVMFLGIEMTPWTAIGIFGFSMSIGSFSFLPGGLGSTEAVMIGLLTLVGIATPDAVGITILARGISLWSTIAIGALATISLGISHKRDNQAVFSL